MKIIRALPARLLVHEVAFGCRPWGSEKVLDGRKEGLRESLERICTQDSRFDQSLQHTYFLRGHTHSLTECRIELTDHIAEWQQMVRKAVKSLKVSPYAPWKAEAVNWTDRYGVLDRVMDSLRSQRLGKSDKVCMAFWHGLTMHVGQIDLPAIVFDRNEQPAAATLSAGPVKYRAPFTWCRRWNSNRAVA